MIVQGSNLEEFYTDRLEIKGVTTPLIFPPRLNVLRMTLEDCPGFKTLPDGLFAQEATIRKCNGFEGLSREAWVGALTIESCPGLSRIDSGLALGRISIIDCPNLKALPPLLACDFLSMPQSSLTELPPGIRLAQGIDLTGSTRLTEIPSMQTEVIRLVRCTSLKTLPENLEASVLDLSGCTGFSWPEFALIEVDRLILNDCPHITHLPEWLTIADAVDVAGSGVRDLPSPLSHVRILWRGVEIDERIAFRPETISPKDILHETNVERRRVMLERLGWEDFLTAVEHSVRHEDLDPGGKRTLLHFPFEDDEDLLILSVGCPSTGRRYFIRVPPWLTTCHAAAAWIAGFENPDEYEPVVET